MSKMIKSALAVLMALILSVIAMAGAAQVQASSATITKSSRTVVLWGCYSGNFRSVNTGPRDTTGFQDMPARAQAAALIYTSTLDSCAKVSYNFKVVYRAPNGVIYVTNCSLPVENYDGAWVACHRKRTYPNGQVKKDGYGFQARYGLSD